MRYLPRLSTAAWFAFNKWVIVVGLWLIVPLFLLVNVAIFLEHHETNPAWAAGNLAAGLAIGSFVLWVSWQMAKARWPQNEPAPLNRP
jgi:hypothetical protein